jgi:hypothetical protein
MLKSVKKLLKHVFKPKRNFLYLKDKIMLKSLCLLV